MNNIYLSICIPTNGRLEILKETLKSIYECDADLFPFFEVVISDNATNDDLKIIIESDFKYYNLKYFKATCEGFLNSINALEMGTGQLLKLHNNYTKVNTKFIEETIELIKKYKEEKPLLFFTNNQYLSNDIIRCNDFDEFNRKVTYFNSYSTFFSIWKSDFENLKNIKIDKMFPHVSLLMNCSYKKEYLIIDKIYFENQEVPNKGGYNLFKTFGIDYLDLMKENEDKKVINNETFIKIREELYYNFFVSWYIGLKIRKNNYTFQNDNIKKSLSKYYKKRYFYKLPILSFILIIKIKSFKFLKKLKLIILNKQNLFLKILL